MRTHYPAASQDDQRDRPAAGRDAATSGRRARQSPGPSAPVTVRAGRGAMTPPGGLEVCPARAYRRMDRLSVRPPPPRVCRRLQLAGDLTKCLRSASRHPEFTRTSVRPQTFPRSAPLAASGGCAESSRLQRSPPFTECRMRKFPISMLQRMNYSCGRQPKLWLDPMTAARLAPHT